MRKRTSYHHGDLRNALITAALALIAEHGVEGFTLRDCAKKAGVSVAAPYRHFTDRDDLLAAVAADCMQRLGDAMDRAVEAAGGADPLSVFRATGIAYVRFAVEHPAHFRVMNLPQVVARTPPEVRDAVDAWGRDMAAKLAAAQAAGTIAPLPLADIMLAASCLTHGLAHMIVDGTAGLGDLDPDAAAQLAVTITGVIGCGFLPRTGAEPKPEPKPKPKRRGARGAGALVLGAIALTGARADAKGVKLLAGTAEYKAPASAADHGAVIVWEMAAKPPAGTYVLLGTQGPVGVLALDRTFPRQGGCPYQAELHLVDAPAWTPGEADHLVVIGPVDTASTARSRLIFTGLARAGHAASEPEEPLGVALPKSLVPTFAVDLDSDGDADLILDASIDHGRFVRGLATVKQSISIWQRIGTRWSATSTCRWTTTDTIE